MYRVHGKDGNLYEAPSLAVLQQWVQEGRIVQTTLVEDLLSGIEGPAGAIQGLNFSRAESPLEQNPTVDYPRNAQGQPVGCAVHMPLVLAIFATMCFPIGGVIAVIYAAKIPEILARGDVERAKQYSRIANYVASLAFLLGIIQTILIMKYGKLLGPPFG